MPDEQGRQENAKPAKKKVGDRIKMIGFPEWNSEKPETSLKEIYTWAVDQANEASDWYNNKRIWVRRGSKATLGAVLVLSSAGALCPIISNAIPVADSAGKSCILLILHNLNDWGYILLALAAAIYGFDRFYGFSSKWMRYIVTQLSIERELKRFHYDWVIAYENYLCQKPGDRPCDKTDVSGLLNVVKDFTMSIENLIKNETDEWIVEFKRNMASLETQLKTETEARRPGSIKAAVANFAAFDNIVVKLDGIIRKEVKQVGEVLIDAVSPGNHELLVEGHKGAVITRDSKVVIVQPGAMANVQVTLPDPA